VQSLRIPMQKLNVVGQMRCPTPSKFTCLHAPPTKG
jgi:hypothetical protein